MLRKRGRFGPVEVHTKRVDGTAIVMLATAIARFDKGVLTEVHSCMLDITDQKKLEAQFRQAQKMEAVGQLAGGMAHDFNNLLTVIKAYVQLALGELDEDAPLRADMKVIGDAADRAAELTRQLLAFSRQQVLQPKRINLHTIITDIEPMIRALLGPEMTLIDEIDRPIPDIEADRSQLEQVLMNLAVNARDAMPKGNDHLRDGRGDGDAAQRGRTRGRAARLLRRRSRCATPERAWLRRRSRRSSSRSSRRRHRARERGSASRPCTAS